jgi:phenylalanyl-tRNA synthetase beta chain
MDIKLSHKLLTQFLDTKATPKQIAHSLSLSGPTIDRIHKVKGDTIYDVEIISNRIDSISAFGIAREAVSILPQFNLKAKLKNDPYKLTLKDLGSLPSKPPVKVIIKNKTLVPRFTCISLENVTVKPSPKATQKILTSQGQRPLNNVVDISNELTLKYGQPVHVFNLDKIKKNTMVIRSSVNNEKITTLDDKILVLKGDDIVIEDGDQNLIDLCGIMGGKLSQVDQNTKNVLLFVQTYEPNRIRQTSLYTQQRTLAAQIFEKSPDPELVLPVLIKGVELLKERASAVPSSQVLDYHPKPYKPHSIPLSLAWLNQLAGLTFSQTKVSRILKSLGFKVSPQTKDKILCQVPSWRQKDILIKEDLAEEILRIYGYYRLPSTLPTTKLTHPKKDQVLVTEKRIKYHLLSLNFTEIYNSSLVSQKLFDKTKMNIKPSVELKNPLSIDHQYLRRSLIPSLLQNIEDNQKHSPQSLSLFELSNIYIPRGEKDLPDENPVLTFITHHLDFRSHKGITESLLKHLNVPKVNFKNIHEDSLLWDRYQSAQAYSGTDYLGIIGKPTPQVLNNFDLTTSVYVSNLCVETLSKLGSSRHQLTPLPKHSSIVETLTVQTNLKIGDIVKKIKNTSTLLTQITYLESYQNKHTFRLIFSHPKKSLTQKEVNQLKTKILSSLK